MKKTIISTGAFALAIIGVLASAQGGNLQKLHFNLFPSAFADDSPCEAGGQLSYDQAVHAFSSGELVIDRQPDLGANKVNVTVTNNTQCSVAVSLGSYKMFGPYSLSTQSQQEFFDGTQARTVAAGTNQSLSVNLPACAAQYDVWYGDALHTLVDNQPYGNVLFGDQVNTSNYCSQPVVVVTTPIVATLTANTSCSVPGAPITFSANVTGDGVTSKSLQKDTNSDGSYGEVANWGAGPGSNSYTSNEDSSYIGTYSIKLMVNGTERARKDVNVSQSCAPVVPPTPTPISASLIADSTCVVPGTPIHFTATASGSNITSKTVEKDTNADGSYGEVASWGSGPGTNNFTSDEPASFSGTYSLRYMVNGVEEARKNITVNASCGPVTPPPTITTVTPITASLVADSACVVPGTAIHFTATVAGDGITSRTLEKDVNGDGSYGEVVSWGSGPGTNTFTTSEPSTYAGTYSLRLMVNGVEKSRTDVTVNTSCGPVPPAPTTTPPVVVPPVVIPPATPGVPVSGGGGGGPSMSITKTPSPASLPNGPGLVTYTYVVTNQNTFQDLTDVSVADDKCGPLVFISGDKNNNQKLDPYENWMYTCTSRLSVTTTNTAVAIAYNDTPAHQPVTATAVATVTVGNSASLIANVPVATPVPLVQFYPFAPNTGFAPKK